MTDSLDSTDGFPTYLEEVVLVGQCVPLPGVSLVSRNMNSGKHHQAWWLCLSGSSKSWDG